MGFLGLMLRAGLRHRWRSWLALVLLAAVAVGMVLAGVQTARRTETAFPRFVATHGYDAFFYSGQPVPHVDAIPGVASVTAIAAPAGGPVTCAGCRPIPENNSNLMEIPPTRLGRFMKLVSGRLPNESDPTEVLASSNLQPYGVHVGSVLRIPLAAASQRNEVLNGNGNMTPSGPVATLHVVGLTAAEIELFPSVSQNLFDIYATTGFGQRYNARTVLLYEYFLKLHGGAAALPRFTAAARAQGVSSATDMDEIASQVQTSIEPQAVGWWILTGLAALVGLIVLAQALARQATVEAEEYPTLGALGSTKRQLFTFIMARTLALAVLGAVGGVALAAVLSVFTPVGEARVADPNPGFDFDALLLVGGAAIAVVVVVLLGLWPAIRASRNLSFHEHRTTARPSRAVAFLSASGAPPTALIGVRNALERGRGRTAVPVGSAIVGAVLAVAVLCGTAVFGASLAYLTNTPSQYGQGFDVWFNTNATGDLAQTMQMLKDLERPGVTSITAGVGSPVRINGSIVDAAGGQAVRGHLLIPLTAGRYPSSDDEIVLGTKTMRNAGTRIGGTVQVTLASGASGASTARTFRVVGTAVLPPDFNGGGLGTGAIVSLPTLTGTTCRDTDRTCLASAVLPRSGVFLVQFAPDAQGQAALAALGRSYSSWIAFPQPPTNLVNFGEAVDFPLIFGVIVVVFGVGTLLHLLLTSVNRRRREMGLLKSLGFVRRQIVWSVSWQTTTVAFIGILLGVPLGVAAGRAVWSAFANNLGVGTGPVVTASTMVLVALGTLLVANALAVVPAYVAARARPASLLRVE